MISNVDFLFNYRHNLFYKKEKAIYSPSGIKLLETDAFQVRILNNYIITNCNEIGSDKTYQEAIDFNLKKVITVHSSAMVPIDNSEYISIDDFYNGEKKTILTVFHHDSENKKREFNYRIRIIEIIGNLVLLKNNTENNRLFAVDTGELEERWTYSLSHFPKYIDDFGDEREVEIDGELKIYKDNLLVPCYNHIFLCINLNTGELVWRDENKKGYYPVYYNQSVVFMTTEQFLELDILTGEIIRGIDVSRVFKDNNLTINATWHETIIYKDKIYRVYSSDFFIAIMDYNTLAYEGKIEIKKTTKQSWQISDMNIHEDKLYVLEWTEKNKNLHIIDLN